MKYKTLTLALGALFAISVFNGINQNKSNDYVEVNAETDYYAEVNTSLCGDDLRSNLASIITKGHNPQKSYNNIEEAMLYTDRNWDLSPNPEDKDPYMWLLYSEKYNTTNPQTFKTCQGSYGVTEGYVWNKEHILPQSMGADSAPAKNDLHHLRASDYNVNNKRGNDPFGPVTSGGSAIVDKLGNTTGTIQIRNSVCQPDEEWRGDIARALFYMATRYSSTFNLKTGFNSQYLSTLLEWHEADPVCAFELRRNGLVQEWQGNRNPYIDHPEYVNAVFKNEPIVEPAKLTGLTLSGQPTKTSYKEGENFDSTGLTVTAQFENSEDKNVTSLVTWTPSPLTKGTTQVTGTYTANRVSKEVTFSGITVTELSDLTYTGTPTKLEYEVGQSFDPTGLTVTAHYGSEQVNVTNNVSWSPDPLTQGTTSVTGSYGDKQITVSGLTVNAPSHQEFEITFKHNSNDGSNTLSDAQVLQEIESGSEYIASLTSSALFSGKDGLRVSSGKNRGHLLINLNSDYTAFVSSIIIGVNKYSSDTTPKIKLIANEESQEFNNELTTGQTTEYKLTVTSESTPSFKIESVSDRFYLSYIKVTFGSDDPGPGPDPTPDPDPDPTPVQPEIKKGCGGDIATTSVILSVISLFVISLIAIHLVYKKKHI